VPGFANAGSSTDTGKHCSGPPVSASRNTGLSWSAPCGTSAWSGAAGWGRSLAVHAAPQVGVKRWVLPGPRPHHQRPGRSSAWACPLTSRATHALCLSRPLHPAALASVPYGIVLVRVRACPCGSRGAAVGRACRLCSSRARRGGLSACSTTKDVFVAPALRKPAHRKEKNVSSMV